MFANADSGLNLTQYRAYDPMTGRWLSRDLLGEPPFGDASLYEYGADNPISLTDPGADRVVRDRSTRDPGLCACGQAGAREELDDRFRLEACVDPSQPISRGSFVDGKPASERLTGSCFDHGDILWRTPLVATSITLPRLDLGDLAQASRQAAQARISSSAGKTTLAVNVAGGAERICQTQQCRTRHIDSAVPLDDGKAYLVTTSDLAHAQTVSLWTPGVATARILAASAGFLNGDRYDDGAPCAVARHAAACIEATPAIPPRLVLIDTHDGRRHVVFEPNALLRARIVDPIRTLRWHGKNGTAFAGQLILPATPVPRPVFRW